MPSIRKLLLYCTIHYVMVYLLKVADITLCEDSGMFISLSRTHTAFLFFLFTPKLIFFPFVIDAQINILGQWTV